MIHFVLEVTPKSLQWSGKRIGVQRMANGQHRPRFYATPSATDYLDRIRLLARRHRPAKPLSGPVELRLLLVLPRPKSLAQVPGAQGLMRHWKRPDATNLLKSIEDALTKAGFWHDDGQVADTVVGKRWGESGAPGRIEVWIRGLPYEAEPEPETEVEQHVRNADAEQFIPADLSGYHPPVRKRRYVRHEPEQVKRQRLTWEDLGTGPF